jgi:hypothetical protein
MVDVLNVVMVMTLVMAMMHRGRERAERERTEEDGGDRLDAEVVAHDLYLSKIESVGGPGPGRHGAINVPLPWWVDRTAATSVPDCRKSSRNRLS